MKSRKHVLALAGVLLGSFTTVCFACSTDEVKCEGIAKLSNTTEGTICYRFYIGTSETNFCLKPGEQHEVEVKSGDRMCQQSSNNAPPKDCKKMVIKSVTSK
jgi:hypothetical protein